MLRIKTNKRIQLLLVSVLSFVSLTGALLPGVASAAPNASNNFVVADTQGGLKPDCKDAYAKLNSSNCDIIKYITIITNAFSAIVGVVVVGMIVVGGIQYSAAGSNPQAVAAARKKITNAIIALIVYIFMFAFLQWVVPGGVI